jgi:hypothetical protein
MHSVATFATGSDGSELSVLGEFPGGHDLRQSMVGRPYVKDPLQDPEPRRRSEYVRFPSKLIRRAYK